MAVTLSLADRSFTRSFGMSRFTGFAFVALTTLIANSSGRLLAEEPQGVSRTFAVFGQIDFSDEDSVLLKVGKSNTTSSTKTLSIPERPCLDGMDLITGSSSVTYITKGLGDTPIGVGWVVDPESPDLPPTGSVTLTGPDALLVQETLFILYSDQGYIYVSTTTSDPYADILTVVTAIFSK
jgi:hypothetical protein